LSARTFAPWKNRNAVTTVYFSPSFT